MRRGLPVSLLLLLLPPERTAIPTGLRMICKNQPYKSIDRYSCNTNNRGGGGGGGGDGLIVWLLALFCAAATTPALGTESGLMSTGCDDTKKMNRSVKMIKFTCEHVFA